MLLGLTYAQFVAVVGGSMIAFDPPAAPQQERTDWIVSLGTNAPEKQPVGQDGFVTIEMRPQDELKWGFKPVYALGLSVDGGAFVSAGVRKDYHFGPVQVTPFFGPTLYQQHFGSDFNSKQLIQFRTGLDVLFNVTPQLGVGMGVYHISNANLTEDSAGIDVTRVTVQYKY